jgi:hypothetical protein
MSNYFLVVGDVSINSDMFLVIDFVNLKKVGSFEGVVWCICVYSLVCISIYICIIFLNIHGPCMIVWGGTSLCAISQRVCHGKYVNSPLKLSFLELGAVIWLHVSDVCGVADEELQ